jgi:hypothetical protein
VSDGAATEAVAADSMVSSRVELCGALARSIGTRTPIHDVADVAENLDVAALSGASTLEGEKKKEKNSFNILARSAFVDTPLTCCPRRCP